MSLIKMKLQHRVSVPLFLFLAQHFGTLNKRRSKCEKLTSSELKEVLKHSKCNPIFFARAFVVIRKRFDPRPSTIATEKKIGFAELLIFVKGRVKLEAR